MSARGGKPVLSVAPMMEWTDRHYRFFMRLITRRTLLYTEMVTAQAILNGDKQRLLGFSPEEHPLALQLGGDDPGDLAESARIGVDYGYDEIDLNVGCPSDRVQSGRFGACLMARPETVARCVEAMREAVSIPVTVKHRIGIDGRESYEEMADFVRIVADAGCDRFIVHARIAILQGLSPAENRTVPPLRYEDVYRLKREFPHLSIEINGGIRTLPDAQAHLEQCDGVMIGRAAYENPFIFAGADKMFFESEGPGLTRREIVERMIPYMDEQVARNERMRLTALSRHLIGLFAGEPGSRRWRRHISENAHRPGKTAAILREAMAGLPDHVLDARPDAA